MKASILDILNHPPRGPSKCRMSQAVHLNFQVIGDLVTDDRLEDGKDHEDGEVVQFLEDFPCHI